MLVSKNAKDLCHPTQNPNASQWNIGCVGFQTPNFRVGHVLFMFFVLISFAFGRQRKPSIQWNMGLKVIRKGKNENSKYNKNLLIEVYLKQYLISVLPKFITQ